MKFALLLLVVAINILSLAAVGGNFPRFGKTHARARSRIFERFFNWNEVSFQVNHKNEALKFSAKIKVDPGALTFEEDKSESEAKAKDPTKFFNNVVVLKDQIPAIDFRLIKACKFEESKSTTMFTGYTFKFTAISVESSADFEPYQVEISYKLGAGLIGGIKFDQVLAELGLHCLKRQEQLQQARDLLIKKGDEIHELLEKESKSKLELKENEDKLSKLKEEVALEEKKLKAIKDKLALEIRALKELSDDAELKKADLINKLIESKESPKRFVQELTSKVFSENGHKEILEKIKIARDP